MNAELSMHDVTSVTTSYGVGSVGSNPPRWVEISCRTKNGETFNLICFLDKTVESNHMANANELVKEKTA